MVDSSAPVYSPLSHWAPSLVPSSHPTLLDSEGAFAEAERITSQANGKVYNSFSFVIFWGLS